MAMTLSCGETVPPPPPWHYDHFPGTIRLEADIQREGITCATIPMDNRSSNDKTEWTLSGGSGS